MAEGPHARIKRYLAEAHAWEIGNLESLQAMAKDAGDVDTEVAQIFQGHATETQRQIDRLEARLKELDATPSGAKGLLSKVSAWGANVASNVREDHDQVENHLFAAYASEHLEMATYSALKAAADTIGDEPTSRLAQQIFDEEKAAGDKIFPHIARLSRKTMIDAGALTAEEQEENRTEYADKGYVASGS